MLVLTRFIGESIRINGNITVRIMDALGKKAVLGITAPPSTAIQKWENRAR